MSTHYFEGRVKAVEQRFQKVLVSSFADKAVFREESIGWWVVFEGWPVSMLFGLEKPDFEVGDIVELTATKRIKP